MNYDFDLLVIGSGSAGFSAAGAARGTGRKIGVIEADKLGGECPNWACVPTKALLRCASVYSDAASASEFGVTGMSPALDFDAVMKRRADIVNGIGGSRMEVVADKMGIEIVHGRASFLDPHTVIVDGRKITSEKFVIATGTIPRVPSIPGIDTVDYWTFREAVSATSQPASLVIVGGGPVGCELATFYATVGTKVTLIQGADAILHREDEELSTLAQASLEKMGVEVYVGSEVIGLAKVGNGIEVQARVGADVQTITGEKLLFAVGKTANTEGLGCRAAGVDLDAHGRIVVNEYLQTTTSHIWAAGDVDGGMQFTHVAHAEGSLAGRNAFADNPGKYDLRVVPRVTFIRPELASVGMTFTEVKAAHGSVLVGSFKVGSLGRSYIDGHREGLVKIVADPKTREVLGGHILSVRAGEMIHQIAIAMHGHMKVDDLALMVHAYPTYSEAIKAAASVVQEV